MSLDESSQDKYERIQRRLQEQILSNYPNPQREGCPGPHVLTHLARESFTAKLEGDSHWEHVTHCSECYREFLTIRTHAASTRERRSNAIRWSIAGTVLLAAILFFVFVRAQPAAHQQRPQNAELAYQPRIIDVQSMTRSAGQGQSSSKSAIELDRGLLALTVQLPMGSKTGVYEFHLRDSKGSITLSKSASARLQAGTTSFDLKLDLRGTFPGRYEMEIRQNPFDWNYYPVDIR